MVLGLALGVILRTSVVLSSTPMEEDGLLSLTLPEDMELKVLLDLVSEELSLKIIYDEQISSKRVTIRAPEKIPRESLLGVLESALRMKGLALGKAGDGGWLTVLEAKELTRIAEAPRATLPEGSKSTRAITQVFSLKHSEPQRVDQIVKPFLTQPGGNSIVLAEQDLLIVTDYASNLVRVAQLVDIADQPGEEVQVRVLPLQHLDSEDAVTELKQILAAKRTASGVAGAPGGMELLQGRRTSSIVAVGRVAAIEEVEHLLATVDVPLGNVTKTYRFTAVSPKKVDDLLKTILGAKNADRLCQTAIDEDSGVLLVQARPEVHERIEKLKAELDQKLKDETPQTRFYKLLNATASEVLSTIRQIEGLSAGDRTQRQDGSNARGDSAARWGTGLQGVEASPAPSGSVPASPAALGAGSTPTPPSTAAAVPSTPPSAGTRRGATQDQAAASAERSAEPEAAESKNARVVADPNTNTIIVVARAEVQETYSKLIHELDRRRPQVLVEVTIVSLDTSSSFSLSVELSRLTEGDRYRALTFSSFGLSEIDPESGITTLEPGLGFNGIVLSANIANAVIRALSTSGRATVLSAPKILVNDNATGTLNSVLDAPYTSVNASTTVATTSFGGFENAGTTISVTPHLSEGNHLNLEYQVTLSTFTGQGSESIPPPRQRNEIQSEVTIPDGHTIVVGGLRRSDHSETSTKVPILGDIPILGHLFRSRSKNGTESTLFVFLKPLVLRDDTFEDLKLLSERDLEAAGLPQTYPSSEPLLMQ